MKTGQHDAVWAKRRYLELAGQLCHVRPLRLRGIIAKHAERWLA
ncbi:MAG: hypothetical protein ACKN9T_08265 [Candidatus Methylumidiphilus sp.]